jgi:hypothetical protein
VLKIKNFADGTLTAADAHLGRPEEFRTGCWTVDVLMIIDYYDFVYHSLANNDQCSRQGGTTNFNIHLEIYINIYVLY